MYFEDEINTFVLGSEPRDFLSMIASDKDGKPTNEWRKIFDRQLDIYQQMVECE